MIVDRFRRMKGPLMKLSNTKYNMGYDNENHDLVFNEKEIIKLNDDYEFMMIEILGSGNFGHVYHVVNVIDGTHYALKISKSIPVMVQSMVNEVNTLGKITNKGCENGLKNIVGYYGSFMYQGHVCIILEKLSFSLYQVLQLRNYIGLPLNYVKKILKDLSNALTVFDELDLMHLDIKPENILMETPSSVNVKLADVGSTLKVGEKKCIYAISRYYRPPEIALMYDMSKKSDIWSLGCVIAEMYLGYPLFVCENELQLLQKIEKTLNKEIPRKMIINSPKANKFFDQNGKLYTLEEYCNRNKIEMPEDILVFEHTLLEDIFNNARKETSEKDAQDLALFTDLIRKMLEPDPDLRPIIQDVLKHPFLAD